MLRDETFTCIAANGSECSSIGTITIPMTCKGKTKIFKVIVVPDIRQDIILGIDFWTEVGLQLDMRLKEWTMLETVDVVANSEVDPSSRLTPGQRSTLDNLTTKYFSRMSSGLGCTNLVEHEILTNAEPIKQ